MPSEKSRAVRLDLGLGEVMVKWRAKGRFVIGSHGRPLITRGTAVLVAAELACATFV